MAARDFVVGSDDTAAGLTGVAANPTAPLAGKTVKIPVYPDPADGPKAFVEFANSLPAGGAPLATTPPSPPAVVAAVGKGTDAARGDHVHKAEIPPVKSRMTEVPADWLGAVVVDFVEATTTKLILHLSNNASAAAKQAAYVYFAKSGIRDNVLGLTFIVADSTGKPLVEVRWDGFDVMAGSQGKFEFGPVAWPPGPLKVVSGALADVGAHLTGARFFIGEIPNHPLLFADSNGDPEWRNLLFDDLVWAAGDQFGRWDDNASSGQVKVGTMFLYQAPTTRSVRMLRCTKPHMHTKGDPPAWANYETLTLAQAFAETRFTQMVICTQAEYDAMTNPANTATHQTPNPYVVYVIKP